jgi:hypothetical protein
LKIQNDQIAKVIILPSYMDFDMDTLVDGDCNEQPGAGIADIF